MAESYKIPASPQDVCPLLTGSAVPAFTLLAANGEPVDLNVSIRRQPTIMVFYRGGW
jgi:peroxiredoxin